MDVSVDVRLDRAAFAVDGRHFLDYVFAGTRRPYVWPLLGPHGSSVVRGQGGMDHPHHTGLAINYGGHSEGGSANVWSDWDEPPYGPGGRMLHRGIRSVVDGAAYGEFAHDLTYVDAHGDAIVEETRTLRAWWESSAARFVDITCEVHSVTDRGPRPFLLMLRLPASLDIGGTGRVTSSGSVPAPLDNGMHGTYRASWVDASGPSGPPPPAPLDDTVDAPFERGQISLGDPGAGTGPWQGVAVLDHPGNHGWPGEVGRYAVAAQITQVHYPPPEAPDGPFTFRHRIYVHDGDGETARVADVAAAYAAEAAS